MVHVSLIEFNTDDEFIVVDKKERVFGFQASNNVTAAPDDMGIFTIEDDTKKATMQYIGLLEDTETNTYSFGTTAFVYGDRGTYAEGSVVNYHPSMTDAVDDVVNDTTTTWETKVDTQPKLFCMNDELKHYLEWEIVYDEPTEEGEIPIDTGKRRNPDTQEVVQFDKEDMEAQHKHYCEYYNLYVKPISRGN